MVVTAFENLEEILTSLGIIDESMMAHIRELNQYKTELDEIASVF